MGRRVRLWLMARQRRAAFGAALALLVLVGVVAATWSVLASATLPSVALQRAPVDSKPTSGPPGTAIAETPTTAASTAASGGDPGQRTAPSPDAATAVEAPFELIAEPLPEAPVRTGPVEYVVEEGDVLWQIAEQFGLRTETLLWANDIDDADLILMGQRLLVPAVDGVYYTVQPGERLVDITARYGVEVELVVASNDLTDLDTIVAGTDIFLPEARPIRAADPALDDGVQSAAGILPPIPLPDNIGALLAAGWLRTEQATALYRSETQDARQVGSLPAGVQLERVEGFSNGRIQVRDPGDGRTRQAMTGWVNAMDLDVGRALTSRELPLGYPAATSMDIAHVFAPYRTQLDGAAYAEANCGPVTIGMALETFGISVPSAKLRADVLNAQRMWGNNVGTLMTALAQVVEGHGLTAHDLYASGGGLYRWTLDDIRQHLSQGHPVVAQVRYRSLPGRQNALYYGDHYILVTGVVPDGFLYNDPIDVDGLGWDRVISAERLSTAMDASDRRYAYAAFAVSP